MYLLVLTSSKRESQSELRCHAMAPLLAPEVSSHLLFATSSAPLLFSIRPRSRTGGLHASSTLPLTFVASSHPRRRLSHGGSHASGSSPCIASLACAAAVAAAACAASPAQAVTAEEVAVVLTKVQNVYLQIIEVMRAACAMVGMFFDQIIRFIKALIESVAPYIEDAAFMVAEITAPITSAVEQSLQSVGIDTRPAVEALKTVTLVVMEATKQILRALEPVALSISQSLLSADSLFLLRAVGAVFLFCFLAPPIFSTVVCAVRGYKGDLSALEALDMVMKKKYLLIDVRTEKDKSKSGVPSLPRYVINRLISVPVEELSVKFKGQLRDYRKAEAEVAAMKISYLKRINKSSNLVILDRFGDVAKSVAKSLTRLGIKNTWAVMDGFDGGKGWIQSRLGTASRNTGIAELLLPSRIISEGAKKIFPSPKDVDVSPQPSKLLPGGYDVMN